MCNSICIVCVCMCIAIMLTFELKEDDSSMVRGELTHVVMCKSICIEVDACILLYIHIIVIYGLGMHAYNYK